MTLLQMTTQIFDSHAVVSLEALKCTRLQSAILKRNHLFCSSLNVHKLKAPPQSVSIIVYVLLVLAANSAQILRAWTPFYTTTCIHDEFSSINFKDPVLYACTDLFMSWWSRPNFCCLQSTLCMAAKITLLTCCLAHVTNFLRTLKHFPLVCCITPD